MQRWSGGRRRLKLLSISTGAGWKIRRNNAEECERRGLVSSSPDRRSIITIIMIIIARRRYALLTRRGRSSSGVRGPSKVSFFKFTRAITPPITCFVSVFFVDEPPETGLDRWNRFSRKHGITSILQFLVAHFNP